MQTTSQLLTKFENNRADPQNHPNLKIENLNDRIQHENEPLYSFAFCLFVISMEILKQSIKISPLSSPLQYFDSEIKLINNQLNSLVIKLLEYPEQS